MKSDKTAQPHLRGRKQRGSGDVGSLMTVMVICGLLSVTLVVLNWVKSIKNERLNAGSDRGRISAPERPSNTYQLVY